MAIEVERVPADSFSICASLMAGFVLCSSISIIGLEMLLLLTFSKICVHHLEYRSIGLVRLRVLVFH